MGPEPPGPVTPMPDPEILYVGGFGRSGSTLLGCILDEADDVVYVGETLYIWTRGLVHDQLCACQERFQSCPFWIEVFEEAFGGFDADLGEEMNALFQQVDRILYLPRHPLARATSTFKRRIRRYVDVLTTFYRAVATVADADAVVDTSKIPSTPYLLRRYGDLPVTTVHLVRDPRAVANSWQREKVRPEIPDERVTMPTASAGDAARDWVTNNLFMEPHRLADDPHLRMRYEDLATDPTPAVLRVLEAADLDAEPPLEGDTVAFTGNHSGAGNPLRFKTGDIQVRLDDDWRENLPRRDAWLVSAITAPLLPWYGYPLRPPLR